MDLRSKTIQDLLNENQLETQKWEQYREEQKSVESNLVEFQKKIEIDVLVPIGTKAFVPGVLYHTNEILVSHFQGYFSKVTTKTALEILDHRVILANNHLQKLKEEYKLFEPKLELPMIKDDGKDIIEEYNEEDEKMWRTNHRESVRRMKVEEKLEKYANKIDQADDVMDLLEELELIEELEGELDKVEPETGDTNEKLKQLISGELKLAPRKERKSHCQTSIGISQAQAGDYVPVVVELLGKSDKTVENVLEEMVPDEISDDQVDEDDDCDNIPLEIRILVESTKNLKITDKIKIFKKKLKTVKKSLKTMKIETEADLEEKIAQLEIKETLDEIIEDMEDNEEEFEENDVVEENETEDEEIQLVLPLADKEVHESSKPKKKYTFNDNVDICYINAKDPPRKISDDRNPKFENTEIDRPSLKKVNIPLIKPKIDYEPTSTFFIQFNHTTDLPPTAEQASENYTKDVISSPFEIYKLIKHKTDGSLPRKGKKGGKQAKFVEVAIPIENEKPSKPLKSILKPGLVMNYESFGQIEEEEIEESQIEENDEQPCDFSKIMGEVSEHTTANINLHIMGEVTEHTTANEQNNYKSPEVLPQGYTAKISKFKQSRKKS